MLEIPPDEPEQWRPLSFSDQWEVSTLGRVRTVERQVRSGGRCQRVPSRIRKPAPDRCGNLLLNFRVGGRSTGRTVQSLVAEAWLPKPPGAVRACNLDGDRRNNRLSNVAWLTREQQSDLKAAAAGLLPPGLTAADICEIRRRFDAGEKAAAVAAAYPTVTRAVVYGIGTRRAWQWVPEKPPTTVAQATIVG